MSGFSTDALILQVRSRGESDKLLLLLSPTHGRFYAILKGSGLLCKREAAATEPYTFSNMEFYEKNGVKWVKNATATETFSGLRMDMDKLFLSAYFADVASVLSVEQEGSGEVLSLTLNTLYKLSGAPREELPRIKAVFEWRAASLAGYMPEVERCHRCRSPVGENCHLDVMGGCVICGDCLQKSASLHSIPEVSEVGERSILCPLTASAVAALQYVLCAENKRIFAFQIKDALSLELFTRATEAYLLHHLEHGFDTLEHYKRLQSPKWKVKPHSEKTEDI